jgi:hypothetical protein
MTQAAYRVLGSGATQLWADGVRPGNRNVGLGDAALKQERPLHVAEPEAEQTLCGMQVQGLREYAVDFGALEQLLRCPGCEAGLEAGRKDRAAP